MTHREIAEHLVRLKENIILIYAFNATGKTRLSVEYHMVTKRGRAALDAGVYYNAYSEDLFVWDNTRLVLEIRPSKLSRYHSYISKEAIEEKLAPYNPTYSFDMSQYGNPEDGFRSVSFYHGQEDFTSSKISRGEERIFIWCFFLALFDVESQFKEDSSFIFIDDPVSSLDEHNIFITAQSILQLIEENRLNERRFIITTHHIGLFSILFDWLKRGEGSGKYKELTATYILSGRGGDLTLKSPSGDVFLYHLHLLQTLQDALKEQLYLYHFVLLRQVLENIASFLGSGRIGFVLSEIGVTDVDGSMDIINSLSHQKAYGFRFNEMPQRDEELFREVFEKLNTKYHFKLH